MKFTKGQLKDLKSIEWFIPIFYKDTEITDEDRKAFLDISERGIYPETKSKGLEALEEGKRWRGIHVGMYEEGVLDGTMPYFVILQDMPLEVVDFMKREMFQGSDKDIIESFLSTGQKS